ncbi:probable polygalacturonase At1g80170 isoform X2 [Triticum dicoccoides]|uniref:probable polygalacturonase At1g80170 isoform X2 n=1 Tax=Triticum dicoccoides TaxID=85692 RepID=UPI0008428997|nr:probable polygalacturonase At1g80170 isoform X2 [Triticum dicoccoides]XP_044344725.1 probable polygalacturonase At1g80170 isoform X2 [Triticum aestivum]
MATAMALLRLAVLAGAVALLLPAVAEARILLSLDDFGAVGDGIADDTQALVDAWTAACASTNGHVVIHVPAGRSYQIWPVTLAGPCRDEIMIFVSGNIIAPDSPEDWERRDGGKWLHFFQVQDLTVSGGGVIDGRGQEWWAQACKGRHRNDKHCTAPDAPKALHFEECHGVRVQGVTLQNGQQHHLTFTRCSNARASFLRVASPESSPGTDGIHLVNSISVHVNDVHIATGGACVSMVGNCTDVRLRYVSCGPGNGISIGSIGETPVADRLEKIEVDTMFIANTSNGLLIKTWQDGCGYARKVKFANVVMKNVSDPIIIDQYRSEHPTPCGSTAATRTVAVEKIDYVNIAGTSASKRAVTFSCSDVVPCRQVSLKDVNLKRLSGRGASAYCRSASGKAAGVVVPESCLDGTRGAAGDEEE